MYSTEWQQLICTLRAIYRDVVHNMKKTKLLLITLILISLNSCSPELTCADFKIGQFYIPETKEMAKYTIVENDSISEFTDKRDSSIKKYIVIREKNT